MGHAYRADGWCRDPRCFRHIGDTTGFDACPDTSGNDIAFRTDVPPDKRDAMRTQQSVRIARIIETLAEKFRWPRAAR